LAGRARRASMEEIMGPHQQVTIPGLDELAKEGIYRDMGEDIRASGRRLDAQRREVFDDVRAALYDTPPKAREVDTPTGKAWICGEDLGTHPFRWVLNRDDQGRISWILVQKGTPDVVLGAFNDPRMGQNTMHPADPRFTLETVRRLQIARRALEEEATRAGAVRQMNGEAREKELAMVLDANHDLAKKNEGLRVEVVNLRTEREAFRSELALEMQKSAALATEYKAIQDEFNLQMKRFEDAKAKLAEEVEKERKARIVAEGNFLRLQNAAGVLASAPTE